MDPTRRAGCGLAQSVRRSARLAALAALMGGAALPALALAAPAAGRVAPAPAPADDGDDGDDTAVSGLVVNANVRNQPGAVVTEIKPELQLSPADIQSYGVGTVDELLNEIAPQTTSGQGRGDEGGPVILLNGKPISGLFEIRDIPTEAILRVDILPEEVALKFGYPASQKVVNIVLRRRFKAVTAEVEGGAPTEGGQVSGQANANRFQVRGDNRVNLALRYNGQTSLTEADRDLVSRVTRPYALAGNVTAARPGGEIDPALSALAGQTVTVAGIPASGLGLSDFARMANAPNLDDTGQYRTLSAATQQVSANAVLARALGNDISMTLNANLGATQSRALQGLPGVALNVPAGDPFSPFAGPVQVDRYVAGLSPLRQRVDGWTGHLGANFSGQLGDWRVTLTANYDHADSRTRTDTGIALGPLQALLAAGSPSFNPFAPLPASLAALSPQATARSLTDTATVRLLFRGDLFRVPAGDVSGSFRIEDGQAWSSTRSQRLGVVRSADLARNNLSFQWNLDVPLTSRKNDILAAIGDLSANGSLAFDRLSHFGTLTTLGYGLVWNPRNGIEVILSHTRDERAPTVAQLSGPLVQTPGSRIFDFATGQTVDVIQVSGGNPALRSDHRNVFKAELNLKPFPKENLTFTANFIASRTDHPISTFPAATADIEAAFPDRFIRDEDGELVQVDYRPVNYARAEVQQLRWGFNFTKRIGPAPPARGGLNGPGGAELRARIRERLAAEGRLPGQGAQGQGGQGQGGQGQGGQGQGGQRRANGQAPNGQAQNGQVPNAQPQAVQPPLGPDGQPLPPPPGGAGPPPGGPPPVGGPDGDGNRGFGGGPGAGPGGGFGGGRGGGRGGFRGGFPPPGAQGSQLQLALYHTVIFRDRFLVRPGGPVLDLLGGSAAGNGGGAARHKLEAQAGVTLNGLGARLSANWQSGTMIRGGAGPNGDLSFSPLTTVSLRLFANLESGRGQALRHPLLAGTRITLSVNNLFDQRMQVRDSLGRTPLSYQPAYLDPVGRVVRLSLRKQFY